MSAIDDKRKETLKKNVKKIKSEFRSFCGRRNAMRGLIGITICALLVWMTHAIHFLFFSDHKDPILAINMSPDAIRSEDFIESQFALRGDADQEWLALPSKSDPIEIDSNWYIPPVTKPLELPLKPMKRLMDSPTNYAGYGPRSMHGILGMKEDGSTHDWEADLLVSLNREFPDYRRSECHNAPFYDPVVVANYPATSVVIIFSNEPWETLMRSVHSVLNNTPPHMLYEIVLVDDGSTFDEYTVDGSQRLIKYIQCCLPPKVKFTRTNTRAGITRARVTGINAAKSDIFVILDSHIEAEPGWLEPLVYRIQQNPTHFTMPMIDGIKKDNHFTPNGGGVGCSLGLIWKVMEHALIPDASSSPDHRILKEPWGYISSPSMSGGLFAGNKQVFLDIGGYDLAMEGWGAENVELGLRLWQCGAQLHCSECSRVAHIFGRGQFYKQKGGEAVMNRLRTAGVWMDEFAVLPWTFNGQPSWKKMGDITEMMQLRKNLQCHDFKWFITNVWPESPIHDLETDLPYEGPLIHKMTNTCISKTRRGSRLANINADKSCPNLMYFKRIQTIGSGQDDESYLTDLTFDWPRPGDIRQTYDVEVLEAGTESDDVRIYQVQSGMCLTMDAADDRNPRFSTCIDGDMTQIWTWDKFALEGKTYYKVEDY